MVAKHLQDTKNSKLQSNNHFFLIPAMFGYTHPLVFHETSYKIVNLIQWHSKQTSEFPRSISRRQKISTFMNSVLQKQGIPIGFVHITKLVWVCVRGSYLLFPCRHVMLLIGDNPKAIKEEIKIEVAHEFAHEF
jgi:hypothetical protein